MRVCVVGTGYVGLVSGTCLADAGNQVRCVDRDAAKIERLKRGELPLHEPGLASQVERNIQEHRLSFTTELAAGIDQAEICFITVDTPPDGDGRADLRNVCAVAESLGDLIQHHLTVVTKSTVPVGTTRQIKQIIQEGIRRRGLDPDCLLDIANNPEFLKEGNAVHDFEKPDRVVVGVEKEEVARQLHELYQPFMRRQDRFIVMDITSSELTKYAANAMLASRISFMNELSRLCEQVGANIDVIRDGLGRDHRIGPEFLYAGLGYGGSCFPKDLKALISLGRERGVPLELVEVVDRINDTQREWFWGKISRYFEKENGPAPKQVAVWGMAFKAETDDVRSAPALDLVRRLLKMGVQVCAYDPVAMSNARSVLGNVSHDVRWCDTAYDCLEGADALVVCTEWREFRSPDFQHMRQRMKRPLIFDGRLLYDKAELTRLGFEYISIGR